MKPVSIFTVLFEAQKAVLNDEILTEEPVCEICGENEKCECEQII